MDLSRKRLAKELIAIARAKDRDIVLIPDGDDLYKWTGYIHGPPDTAFSDGWFKLKFELPLTYPQAPPNVKFLTRVFHPNVHF